MYIIPGTDLARFIDNVMLEVSEEKKFNHLQHENRMRMASAKYTTFCVCPNNKQPWRDVMIDTLDLKFLSGD